MNILVVGSGGREHAIIRALKQSPKAEVIYALPGNGGIAADAICVEGKATDIDGWWHSPRRTPSTLWWLRLTIHWFWEW